jgi:hypothetical protein
MYSHIVFFFYQQYIKIVTGKFPGNGAAGNPAAYDQYVRPVPFKTRVMKLRNPHGRNFSPRKPHPVYKTPETAPARPSLPPETQPFHRQEARRRHIGPGIKRALQNQATIIENRPDLAVKTGTQPVVNPL